VNLNRFVAVPQVSLENASPCIAKTPEHVRIIRESRLSASSLQNYLHCPAKFFYHTVEKLYSEDELRESLDAGEFGNVFHDSMKELYQGKKIISRDYLEELLGSEDRIKEIVSSKICEQLHTFEVSGKNLIHRDIVCQYVMMVLKRDLEQMDQYKVNSFNILRLEKKEEFEVDGLHFTGTIDRLDSFIPSEVRVVDYKTGKVSDMERDINDSNASKVVDALFGPKNSGRPKIALQLYLYDLIAAGMKECEGARLLNCIYQPSSLFKEAPLGAPLSPLFAQKMKERLSALLREMTDVSVPFRRCENEEDCQYCDYKGICGR